MPWRLLGLISEGMKSLINQVIGYLQLILIVYCRYLQKQIPHKNFIY